MIKLPQREIMASSPLKVGNQLSDTTYITPKEWRWLTTASLLLALLVFAPLIWFALVGSDEWQFMGVLHNPLDGATYLSKIELGYNGSWLVYFQHTPEDHAGAFIQVLYLTLGHLARLIGVTPLIVFHVARLGAALVMYIALYQCAAALFSRVRTRRTFFVIASIGSGFGWILAGPMGTVLFPDFALLPEAYSFFSTLVNVHFPLTIALLMLLMVLLIGPLRPGAAGMPSYTIPGVAIFSLLLSLLYPQALVPIGLALTVYTGLLFFRRSKKALTSLRLLLTLGLPAVPFAAYYFIVVRFNPTMAAWNAQNLTPPPPLLILLLGFGLPLIVALPGIIRAARRFEGDGDGLMLLWLAAIIVSVYLPTTTGRRFAAGMMLPIAYFATRAIEDVWLNYITRRWRNLLFALLTLLMAVSPLVMLFLPVTPALVGLPQAAPNIFLERDYAVAFGWLAERTDGDDVILAAPVVSTWIPGWVGSRAVTGHPYETIEYADKEDAVRAWYAGTADCETLIAQYDVRYVLVGPQEAFIGPAPCVEGMMLVAQAEAIRIYAPASPAAP